MAMANTKNKRGPPPSSMGPEVPWAKQPTSTSTSTSTMQPSHSPGKKAISVDSILGYASEIPSAQRRGPPVRPAHTRTPSGRHPLDPKLSGRLLLPQHMPARTSKTSEKLVLLPESTGDEEEGVVGGEGDEKGFFGRDADARPPRDDELPGRRKEKTDAERLPKSRRTEQLSRVTAYCTAQAYKMRATAEFVRKQHNARTKLYDDCLYCVYHLPLLPGHEGYRVRSSPVLKSPGGKSLLDEEIERNERRVYHEGYFGETEQYGVRGHDEGESPGNGYSNRRHSSHDEVIESPQDASPARPASPTRIAPDAKLFGELFVFGYGVAVFWNFTERQEKDILADLTFSEASTGVSLATRPQREEDFETEEFHFEYKPDIPEPRVFNDMITLKSGDHMIKLSMSHPIAQSTKLSFFEERMARTMLQAQDVPRRLSIAGKLGMKRDDVVRMLGRLYTSRVEVNLSSNMLDKPEFFYDSEPTLEPLYKATREYLEIDRRVLVLNERCDVFLDLSQILSDSIADKKMTRITWIIIVLIVISIVVTTGEVFLRFGIVATGKHGNNSTDPGLINATAAVCPPCSCLESALKLMEQPALDPFEKLPDLDSYVNM